MKGDAPIPRQASFEARPLLHFRPHTFDVRVVREIWIQGRYDVDLPFTPSLILDCGAHIGLTSRRLADRFPDAHVISAEPHPDTFAVLEKNMPFGELHNVAIGAESGEATFAINEHPQKYNAGSIERNDGKGDSFTVPVKTIDEILDGRRVDLIKMDIEGTEQSVLPTGGAWLEHVRALLIEVHPKWAPGIRDLLWEVMDRTGRPYTHERMGNTTNFAIVFQDG